MRALLLLPIVALTSAIPRVKRQWGPADFYHFEQWVNYVNRPRQEFSGDAPGYHTGIWGNLERNVQPHQAPPGWRLDQGNGHWGLIPPQTGYGFPIRPAVANKPPVVIETNVFRTNDNRYFPTEVPYVTPPNVIDSEVKRVETTTTTTKATTTTNTQPPTTTEDERERFIQTVVKEDMDRVLERKGKVEPSESTTSTSSTLPSVSESTTEVSSSTTGVLSGLAAELLSLTTASNSDSTEVVSSPTPKTTSNDLASGFTSLDYNTVWSEENTQASSTTPVVTVESASEEPSTTFVAKMEEITPSSTETPSSATETHTVESSTLSETSSSLVPSSETTETQTEPTTTGTAFLVDIMPGLRAPPLPVDIAKKLQELGVAIEKQL